MHLREVHHEDAELGFCDMFVVRSQRKAVWPEYFFCHSCDLFEDAIMIGNRRANCKQIKYRCTAAHDNASHPTTVRSGYRPKTRNSPALTCKQSLGVKLDAEGKNNGPINIKPAFEY
jgi:hypothetical protein